MSTAARTLSLPGTTRFAGVLGAALLVAVVAYALARSPWMTAGAVLGAGLLLLTTVRPLLVLTLMLLIGPVDLSFLTGGFKALFAHEGGLDMNGIRLIGMVVALLTVAVADRQIVSGFLERNGRWYVAFLLFAAATLPFSPAPLDGLRLLLKLAYPFLLFMVLVGVIRRREDIERMVDSTLAGAAVLTLLVAPILLMLGKYTLLNGRLNIPLLGVSQNPFSFYLLIMTLVSGSRFVMRRQYRYLSLCAVLLVWLGATMTRITVGAGVAALFTGGLLAALVARSYRVFFLALAGAVIVIVALLPMVLTRTFGHVASMSEVLSLAASPTHLYAALNLEGRQVIWPIIFQQFLRHPLTGLGLGSSTALLRHTAAAAGAAAAHDEYLRLLSETGLVGTGLFTAALLQWWWTAVRAARIPDPLVRELAFPAFAGLVAWAVISLTDNSLDYYAMFTQFVAFLTAATLVATRLRGSGAAGETVDGGAQPSEPMPSRLEP